MAVNASRKPPSRLVSTKSGLYFEWAETFRARIPENCLVVPDYEFSTWLLSQLLNSDWKRPPSMQLSGVSREWLSRQKLDEVDLRCIQRAWLHAVRKWYGKDSLGIALRIYPRELNLIKLARVKSNVQILSARLSEQPNLGPLLACDPGMWVNLSDWRIVKFRFASQGLSNGAWRWIAHMPKSYIAKLEWGSLAHTSWVNVHAAINLAFICKFIDRQTASVVGFSGLNYWVRRNHERLRSRQGREVIRAIRICLNHLSNVESTSLLNDIIREEIPLITDWLLAKVGIERGEREEINRSWTYTTLIAKQTYWHISDLTYTGGNLNVYWPEHVGRGHLGQHLEFIELTSLQALLQESRKMHHCVPSYLDRCLSGSVCLFHLLRTGTASERATLELTRCGASGWTITQLKGPCNIRASEAMWAAAYTLLGKMNGKPDANHT